VTDPAVTFRSPGRYEQAKYPPFCTHGMLLALARARRRAGRSVQPSLLENYVEMRKPLDPQVFTGAPREEMRAELAALNDALPGLDWVENGSTAPALSAPRHDPLSRGSVTMPGRSSVSRVRGDRTHAVKGGRGNGPAQVPRP
jgi:hypothetical protein